MTKEDQALIIGALDSLGVALADHDHEWTEGERCIYEAAVECVQRVDKERCGLAGAAWLSEEVAIQNTRAKRAQTFMKRLRASRPINEMICVNCGKKTPQHAWGPRVSIWAHFNGWDWFTGFLADVKHFCPNCVRSPMRQRLFKESQIRPGAEAPATSSDNDGSERRQAESE